jgi:hypothetical protein
VNKVDGKLQELCELIRRQQQQLIEAILTSTESKVSTWDWQNIPKFSV